MAVGDAVAAILGTATTNRQPSAGVEEQISAICKSDATDAVRSYDGSDFINMFSANAQLAMRHGDSSHRGRPYNMNYIINNTVYLRKDGTTDRITVHGVQVG